MNTFYKITFKLFKRPRMKLEEIFTPAKAADINYIEQFNLMMKIFESNYELKP